MNFYQNISPSMFKLVQRWAQGTILSSRYYWLYTYEYYI